VRQSPHGREGDATDRSPSQHPARDPRVRDRHDDAGVGSTPNGTTTTYSDTTTDRRTTYAYYVEAWNAYGPSPPSNELTVRTK